MVNLKAKPFYLSDEQVQWVENSIAGMTLEEKLGRDTAEKILWKNAVPPM